MSSNLYEVLELSRNASPDDVRKAYRRLALKTHPDRLPPNSSQAEKEAANERFRLVNNAYEVLNDPKNRELYNSTGQWPPVAPEEVRAAPRRQSAAWHDRSFFGLNDPFAQDPFFMSSPFNHPLFSNRSSPGMFHLTDPFVLFNSIFGDINRHMSSGMGDPFAGWVDHNNHMGNMIMSPFGGLWNDHGPSNAFSSSFSQMGTFSGGSGSGRWISQSTVTKTINGRTETVIKQRDAQGNEHIRYQSPEGERYTINGVEQPVEHRGITNGSQEMTPSPSQHSNPVQGVLHRSPHRSASVHSHSSHHSHHTSSQVHEHYDYTQPVLDPSPASRRSHHHHDATGPYAPAIASHSHHSHHIPSSVRSRHDTPPPAYRAPNPPTDSHGRRHTSSRRETYTPSDNEKSRHN